MFCPIASFWGTTLGKAISEFGSTSAANVSLMKIMPKLGRGFPYLLPSDLLGGSLNIPSSLVLANAPLAPTITRITLSVGISQYAPNPMLNYLIKKSPYAFHDFSKYWNLVFSLHVLCS